MFRDQWDSENYPSSEDYKEARKLGTVVKNKSVIDKPATGLPDIRRLETAPSAQTTRASQRTTNPKTKPSLRHIKLIFVIIMLIAGVLPNLSGILDQVTDAIFPKQQFETASPAQGSYPNSTLPSYLKVPGEPAYFSIDSSTPNSTMPDPVLLKNLSTDGQVFLLAGMPTKDHPILTLSDTEDRFDLIESSSFKTSEDGERIFNADGSIINGCRIEVVFTDLTNDGLDEALVYYTTLSQAHFAEVFFNGGEGVASLRSLDYFELYTDLCVTEKGTIERLNDDGSVYDEIEVTPDGLYLVE